MTLKSLFSGLLIVLLRTSLGTLKSLSGGVGEVVVLVHEVNHEVSHEVPQEALVAIYGPHSLPLVPSPVTVAPLTD